MALRAGYYGLKRFERNKLSILAESMPADIGPDNPIAGKNDVLTSIDLLDDTVGWLGKNKNVYPYQQASKTSGSLSVIANTDGSIDVNGTNDTGGYVDFSMQSRTGIPVSMWLPKGRYIVSVGYEGEFTDAYAYVGNTYNNAYHVLVDRIPFGKDGKLLVIDENVQADAQYKREDGSCLVAFYLGFPNGSTATNLKLYPMICDEAVFNLSSEYEPPHASVAEELAGKMSIGWLLNTGDDLNDVTETGIYSIANAPTNSPESTGFCSLIVDKSINGDTRQIIIKSGSAAGYIYVRSYAGSPLSWQPWFKFTGTEVTPASLTKEEETKKTTKKKVIKEEEE